MTYYNWVICRYIASSPAATHKYTPKHDFNPMDCTDMIIGSARGTSHRIGDYYSRDRSTPRRDSYWGGKDSLTAAMGFEKDGVTTIVFRRKLAANEPTDHEIADSEMLVIWAKGQEPGNYIHVPPSGLEKSKVSVEQFYKPDELKYHGHKSQRGVASFNLFGTLIFLFYNCIIIVIISSTVARADQPIKQKVHLTVKTIATACVQGSLTSLCSSIQAQCLRLVNAFIQLNFRNRVSHCFRRGEAQATDRGDKCVGQQSLRRTMALSPTVLVEK